MKQKNRTTIERLLAVVMKKGMRVLAAVCVSASIVFTTAAVQAADVITSDTEAGADGTLSFRVEGCDSADGYTNVTLYISGEGAMRDYNYSLDCSTDIIPNWRNTSDSTYKPGFWGNKASTIVVEAGTTHLGSFAFANMNVQTVRLADSITSIGAYIFSTRNGNYNSLIYIPDSVTSIDGSAFQEYSTSSSQVIARIVCSAGSYAAQYAASNGITCYYTDDTITLSDT